MYYGRCKVVSVEELKVILDVGENRVVLTPLNNIFVLLDSYPNSSIPAITLKKVHFSELRDNIEDGRFINDYRVIYGIGFETL